MITISLHQLCAAISPELEGGTLTVQDRPWKQDILFVAAYPNGERKEFTADLYEFRDMTAVREVLNRIVKALKQEPEVKPEEIDAERERLCY